MISSWASTSERAADTHALGRRTVYTYDDAKLLATEAWYDNTDVMGGYTEYDHDSEGRMTAQRRYDAGPDGTFGTGDDFVQVQWIYVLP